MKQVHEESAAELDWELRDFDGTLVVPTSLAYQIHDIGSDTEVKAETSLTPGSTGTISLTPTDNTLVSQDNTSELRLVTLIADKGLSSQFNDRFIYEVVNLDYIT